MNSLFAPTPFPPHFHEHTRFSPTRSMSATTPSQSRKRKASPSDDQDDFMSSSPSASPSMTSQTLPHLRSIKKPRGNLSARSLSLPRLLETLDSDSLRSLVHTICTRHPEIEHEVSQLAPRPSATSTLEVLRNYQQKLRSSFPFGGDPRAEYAYNRVKPALTELLDAMSDFTPQYLPPSQHQTSISLSYLDGVTQIIHELPDWDRASNNMAKVNAYEEIARAWALVLREAGKRGAGMGVLSGGWDGKIRGHNEQSGGKMGEAVEELGKCIGWMAGQHSGTGPSLGHAPGTSSTGMSDRELVRQQLFSGTYGAPNGIRTGFW